MPDVAGALKSAFAALEPDEALRQPVTALLGVSSAAQTALEPLGVRTIFDLAASRVFAAAAGLVAVEQDPTSAEARLNVIAGDVAEMPPGVPVRELADQPISILRALGESAGPVLAEALDVVTVRDLALWPPYHAAKAILGTAFFPEQAQGFDPEAPADLLPKSGVYPTERIFFRKLVIDAVPEPTEGAQAIEQAPPIDLAAALAAPVGFGRLATGALLTFSQSWFSQGLTLGQLLHSTSLAPGESTRIAVVDWSRRSRAAASEDIAESELLSNTMSHSRSLSEVTTATAREFQSGQSSTRAESTAAQAGVGFRSRTRAAGDRRVGRRLDQHHRGDERIVLVRRPRPRRQLRPGHQRPQPAERIVGAEPARVDRARGLAVRARADLDARADELQPHACALDPLLRSGPGVPRRPRSSSAPIAACSCRSGWSTSAMPAIVDRWRLLLAGAALSERVRRQLTVEYGVVEIIPQTPKVTPGGVIVGMSRSGVVRHVDVPAGHVVRRDAQPAAHGPARHGPTGGTWSAGGAATK